MATPLPDKEAEHADLRRRRREPHRHAIEFVDHIAEGEEVQFDIVIDPDVEVRRHRLDQQRCSADERRALIFWTGIRAFGISTSRSRGRVSIHACPPTGSIRSKAIVSARLLPRGSTSRPNAAGSSGSSPSAESTPIIKKFTGSDELVSVSSRSPENWIRPRSATPSYSSTTKNDAPIEAPMTPTRMRASSIVAANFAATPPSRRAPRRQHRSARRSPAEISPRAGDGSRRQPRPRPAIRRRKAPTHRRR